MSNPFGDTPVGPDSGSEFQAATSPDTSSTNVQPEGTSDTSLPADNPAWAPMLEGIPDLFQPQLKRGFSKWDENYRGLQTKYNDLETQHKAFEPFKGVDPQAIHQALSLTQAINKNPLQVYQMMEDYVRQLGLLQNQQSEQEPELPEDQQRDPWQAQLEERQAQLDERQQKMDQYVQEQMYERSVQTYQAQVDSQLQDLVDKYGEQAVDLEDVLGRMYNQVNQGKELSAEQAFQDSRAAFQRIYARMSQGRPAPNIIPPNGTVAPTETKPVSQMTSEERQAHLAKMIQFANSQT